MIARTLLCMALYFATAYCWTEQGIRTTTLKTGGKLSDVFSKSMYNNTKISITMICGGVEEVMLNVNWILKEIVCINEFTEAHSHLPAGVDLEHAHVQGQEETFFHKSFRTYNCSPGLSIDLDDETNIPPTILHFKKPVKTNVTAIVASKDSETIEVVKKEEESKDDKAVRKRSVETPKGDGDKPVVAGDKSKVAGDKSKVAGDKSKINIVEETSKGVVLAWHSGVYIFEIEVQPVAADKVFNVSLKYDIHSTYGYLAAIEWPLLPFYSTMCAVYMLYGIIWLVLSACNWRDMLRVQFWIGGVILLGMLEKAAFVAEYESLNEHGVSVPGAVMFAELVSCLKRALARMLIVIVSLGFGIVKPRLGPMLHRVVGMGVLYFVLSAVEGSLRARQSKSQFSKEAVFASISLAVFEVLICWWIFSSLVATQRTLRLRRNLVKLSLYRHFTNTLIFAVIASLIFMIWSFQQYKMKACMTDWHELWVEDAFWHLLFSVILAVILVLWRPTINNQRYAFSPLRDAADDNEDGEPLMNDAFEGIKSRNVSLGNKTQNAQKEPKTQIENDLKWIEDNIPSTVADSALPSLLDSDDEIQTTRFEMSKMN